MKYASYKLGIIIDIYDSSSENIKYITIASNPNNLYTSTTLIISEKTLILDINYEEIYVENLKVGNFILAYHSNAMTMSIPPQTKAFIIELK